MALVSLHSGHHNKTPNADFARVEASSPWTPAELPLDALIDHISSGKAFVNALLDGGRSNDNCTASSLIILDVDGDLTLDELWAIPFAQRHCAFTYTSCSHLSDTKQQERGSRTNHSFRALFPAERVDLSTAEGQALYAERYHLLLERLGITLKDSSPAKPSQPWYGNTAAEFQFGQGIPLDWEFSADAADRLVAKATARQQLRQQSAPRLDDDGLDEQRAVYLLDHLLRSSADGDFSGGYWVKVLNACAASGSDAVREAFMAWHGRGHHSKTQKGIARRYDKAGHRSGLGALFALAKEQHGSEWYKLLPPELQRKGQAPAQPKVLFSKAHENHGAELSSRTAAAEASLSADDKALAKEAASHIYSHFTTEQVAPINPGKDGADDDGEILRNLIGELFLLRAYGQRTVNGIKQLVPSREVRELDRRLLGAILECKGFINSPSEVERDLIDYFRWELDLLRNDWGPVTGFNLTGNPDNRASWLIPNWFLADGSHIIYSKAGVGKTYLSIQVARAITGDPSLPEFLDSGPICGQQRWRQSTVLFIGSDMGAKAKQMTETYINDLGLTNMPFLEYVEWWFESQELNTPLWTMSISHLIQLYNHLEKQQGAGLPVKAVIVDSMKAVCPDHLLVGQQAFKDYFVLMGDICRKFHASLIWIHHASASNGGAQGIQRITEAPDVVMKMEKNDQKQIFLDVEKIRAGRGRKIMIDPFRPGAPALLMGAADLMQQGQEEEQPMRTNAEHRQEAVRLALRQHLDSYCQEHFEETGARLALLYKGMTASELASQIGGVSRQTLLADLEKLIQRGEAERRGHSTKTTYRLRLEDNGEVAQPFDLFTAGW